MNLVTKTTLFTSFVIVTSLSFTACSNVRPQPQPQTQQNAQKVVEKPKVTQAQKDIAYKATMHKVGGIIKSDPNYQKLDLKTPELKNWFTDITYKLWDHQITRNQFVAFGLEKFPQRAYEFNLIADGISKN